MALQEKSKSPGNKKQHMPEGTASRLTSDIAQTPGYAIVSDYWLRARRLPS